MRVTHNVDPETHEIFREIIETSYQALDELRKAYEGRGKKTWMNIWNPEKNEWLLTINMGREMRI